MKITGLKEGERVTIEQTKASEKGSAHVKLDETVQDVSGQIHKVEVREYSPREGEKAKELKIWLKDSVAEEMYAVSCNMNSMGRGIINTLLSLEPPYGELMIRVYNKKDSGFPAAYITHNGAKVGWKYQFAELSHLITTSQVRENGVMKTKKDYWDMNEYLINELNETVVKKLSSVPKQFQDGPELKSDLVPASETLAPEDTTDGTDDLPF